MANIKYGFLEVGSTQPADGLTKAGEHLREGGEWVVSCPGDYPVPGECYAIKKMGEGYVVDRETLCINCPRRPQPELNINL